MTAGGETGTSDTKTTVVPGEASSGGRVTAFWRKRRWVRRLLVTAVTAPVVVAVVGFWVAPPIVRSVAEGQLAKALGRRVTIGRVRMNPFSLSLAVEKLQIFEADGSTPFVGFGRFYVNAQLASIYHRAPVIRELSLDAPRVHLARLKSSADAWADLTTYNFSDILARLSAGPKEPEPPPRDGEAPARFSLNNIRISDGEVVFEDRPLGSTHKISGFAVGVPFVSTLPTFIDTFVEPGLRVTIDGTPFALGGRTKPFKDSLETTVELRADDFDLTKYLPYVPVPLRFDVASALLDVNVDVSFVRPRVDAPRLTAKGRIALEKVSLRERLGTAASATKGSRPLLAFDALEVLIGEANLTSQTFKIDRVTLSGLDVHARRHANGSLNLEQLVPAPSPAHAPSPSARQPSATATQGKAPTSASAAAPSPLRFAVREFALKGATLHGRDETVQPPFELTVNQLGVTVHGLSNAPGGRASVTAGFRAEPGGTFKQEGTLSIEPLVATGTVRLDGVEPARFAPYYRDQIAFDIRQGQVAVGTEYQFAAGKAGNAGQPATVRLKAAFVELANLALRRRGAADDFFTVHDLAVRGVEVDPGKRVATVGAISTHDARIRAARDERGTVDLTTLVVGSGAGPGAGAGPGPGPSGAPSVPDSSAPPWAITVERLDMEGWSARFEDKFVKPKAVLTIGPVALKATKLGTAPGTRGTIDLRMAINKTGRLAVTGSASLDPAAADLRIDLRTLEILPLQPYFADQVNLVVTDGAVSIKANARIDVPAASAARARSSPPEPRVHFSGDIDVGNFASVDGVKHEEFLKWKSLHFGQLAVSTVPLAFAVHDIALTDFYSRLMISSDAHFNVEDVLAPPGAGSAKKGKATAEAGNAKGSAGKAQTSAASASTGKSAQTAASVPPPKITIGQVTLQGGHVSFSDQLIRPHYAAELTDLAGRISGLSADGATQADVDIRGSVDHSGNLSIVGKANPLAKDLFVDVKVDLKDFELPPTSPYAAKYAGYGVAKGKLALALDYHIAHGKLDAKNRLIVEQFSFGEKVPSPDATALPVRLAVALLKDRHGVIDINLPIAGSLDSPDFKIGRAILKVLGNLIVKAATAPFSMIASLFGGGDELSRVEFPQGVATLDAKGQGKLASLAKALRERPGLSFEIEGNADRDRDRESLKRNLSERKLKAQKMLELVASGAAVSNPDEVRFDDTERPRLMEKAYQAETFSKPRNVLGRPKSLPIAEMEKLMLANTIVDDDALRLLAERRATVVREALAKLAPDGATRLFLVSPRVATASKEPSHRVEFRLKKD